MKPDTKHAPSTEAVDELVSAISELNRAIRLFSVQLDTLVKQSRGQALSQNRSTLDKDELELLLPKPTLH